MKTLVGVGIVLMILGLGMVSLSVSGLIPLSISSSTSTYTPTGFTQICSYNGYNICKNSLYNYPCYGQFNPPAVLPVREIVQSANGLQFPPYCGAYYSYTFTVSSSASVTQVRVGLNMTIPSTQSGWTLCDYGAITPSAYTVIANNTGIVLTTASGYMNSLSIGIVNWITLNYPWTPTNLVTTSFGLIIGCNSSTGAASDTMYLNTFPLQVTYSYSTTTPPLTAAFTESPSSTQVGQSVSFSATAGGGFPPYYYSWQFGDGAGLTKSALSTTTHAYSTSGNYTVILTVNDSNNTAPATATHTVNIVSAPSVTFTWSPTSPQSGQMITFTAVVVGGVQPYTFAWSFGDLGTGAGNPVTHTYPNSGIYSVLLTVTTAVGTVVSIRNPVTVTGVGGVVVSFTYSTYPTAGQPVQFTASVSGTSTYTVSWNFGDGGTGTGFTVSHTFVGSGNYNVTMIVISSGFAYYSSQQVSVAGGCTFFCYFSNPLLLFTTKPIFVTGIGFFFIGLISTAAGVRRRPVQ